MYFLFTTVLTASFLINIKFTAVGFTATLLLTVLYLYLFSVYFRCCRKTTAFVPLILASISIHITFFLIEMVSRYIKDVNIWILAAILIFVCVLMASGSKLTTGIGVIANMSSPIFFMLIALTIIVILSGKTAENPIWDGNIYQYISIIITPPSTALTLNFMQKCRFRKQWPAFVSAVAITVFFYLFDTPFFKNIALTFIAPVIIASEMLVIKETILPSQETIDNNAKERMK